MSGLIGFSRFRTCSPMVHHRAGWRVVRVWEHELKVPAKVAAKLVRAMGTARG
ncbi:MAG: hypothetical protein JNM55_20155 [Anaerolineales bacterium]|nr:hypothetical protein [Anaerolineales bacterium]